MIVGHSQKLHNEFYGHGVVIVQQPSSKRIINVSHRDTLFSDSYDPYDDNYKFSNNNYFLSVPNIIFRIYYKLGEANVGDHRLSGMVGFFYDEKKLYMMPFHNIDSFGWICLGQKFIEKSIEQFAKKAIENFWANTFNNDMTGSFDIYRTRRMFLSNYNSWQKKTKENPDWKPTSTDLIEYKHRHDGLITSVYLEDFLNVDCNIWNDIGFLSH